jgi:enolase
MTMDRTVNAPPSTRHGTLIEGVFAWEALDSRGNPTVAAEVTLRGGARGTAVPSGASTGTYEAHELRDGGTRYGGKGVRVAVANANGPLAQAVRGADAARQDLVDSALRETDGTASLSRLGANAVLAISVASAMASAAATGQPLYRAAAPGHAVPVLPLPMVNIISGGAHAGRNLDIQDLLVVPVGAGSFADAIEMAWRVRRGTAEALDARGLPTALIADEGGLGPALPSNRAALALLREGIERARLVPGQDAAIAATQFYDPDTGRYRLRLENREITAGEWVAELAGWCRDFPVVSLEDPLADQDWENWTTAAERLSGIQLLGDDLFVTDAGRLARGIEDRIANAVLVKPNQTGTLTDAARVVSQARAARFATVLSARSGETEDSWLADLAVAWQTRQIKVGSTMRSERTAKWNRLLRIEAELSGQAAYAGVTGLGPVISD